MTQQPIDYASGPPAKTRAGRLADASLFLSLAGIALGLGLSAIGALIGFGARGGGPGIPVAAVGLILGPVLNLVAFVLGIVALFRKGPKKTRAIIGTTLSGIIVLSPLALALLLALNVIKLRG